MAYSTSYGEPVNAENTWETAFTEMERALLWIRSQVSIVEGVEEDEALIRVANQILQCAILMEDQVDEGETLICLIREVKDLLCECRDSTLVEFSKGARERPSILISTDQITFDLQHGFKVSDIATMFGCSRKTVERRMRDAGLGVRSSYSFISDADLQSLVEEATSRCPMIGEKSIDGMLKAQGINVQRQRIREALYTADPNGVKLRLRRALHRREYHVEAPNALWHVDGYHKLVRWRIIIHGGIDGFSRVVLYLKAATNNRVETVFSAFLGGVAEYGLPS